MSSIRINLTRTGCCVLFCALALICSLPSYAGTEEVSLYSMSQNWGAAYDNSKRTLTFSDVANWNKGRGWNFDWKYIDGNIESYIIEFGSATTAAIAVEVKYSYNYTDTLRLSILLLGLRPRHLICTRILAATPTVSIIS